MELRRKQIIEETVQSGSDGSLKLKITKTVKLIKTKREKNGNEKKKTTKHRKFNNMFTLLYSSYFRPSDFV